MVRLWGWNCYEWYYCSYRRDLSGHPLQHRWGDLGLINAMLCLWLVIYQGCGFVNMAIFMLYIVSVMCFPSGLFFWKGGVCVCVCTTHTIIFVYLLVIDINWYYFLNPFSLDARTSLLLLSSRTIKSLELAENKCGIPTIFFSPKITIVITLTWYICYILYFNK